MLCEFLSEFWSELAKTSLPKSEENTLALAYEGEKTSPSNREEQAK